MESREGFGFGSFFGGLGGDGSDGSDGSDDDSPPIARWNNGTSHRVVIRNVSPNSDLGAQLQLAFVAALLGIPVELMPLVIAQYNLRNAPADDDLRHQSEMLAQILRRDDEELARNPRQSEPILEQVLSKNIVDVEKLLRNLGAKDKDMLDFICPIGSNFIIEPVKIQTGENTWDYFEKSALEAELKRTQEINPYTGRPLNRGYNPKNRQPLKPDEPLAAPEFKANTKELINSFIENGLRYLGASEDELENSRLKEHQDLKTPEFSEKLINLIRSLYEKRLRNLGASEEQIKKFCCPLTKAIIFDPVKLKDVETNSWIYFERSALEQSLIDKPNINPVTQKRLGENEQPREATEFTENLWDLIRELSLKKVSKNEEDNTPQISSKPQTDKRQLFADAAIRRQNDQRKLEEQRQREEQQRKQKEQSEREERLREEERRRREHQRNETEKTRQEQLNKIALDILSQRYNYDSIRLLNNEIRLLRHNETYINKPNHKEFCDSLTKLTTNLEEHIDTSTAKTITQFTLLMLLKLRNPAADQKTRLEILTNYENDCKQTPGWQKFLKVLGMVCLAAVGFIVGAAVGMGIGIAFGAWSGPGAFVTGALGLIAGGVVGAAMITVVTGAATTGFVASVLGGLLMFKPTGLRKEACDAAELGTRFHQSLRR